MVQNTAFLVLDVKFRYPQAQELSVTQTPLDSKRTHLLTLANGEVAGFVSRKNSRGGGEGGEGRGGGSRTVT